MSDAVSVGCPARTANSTCGLLTMWVLPHLTMLVSVANRPLALFGRSKAPEMVTTESARYDGVLCWAREAGLSLERGIGEPVELAAGGVLFAMQDGQHVVPCTATPGFLKIMLGRAPDRPV